MLTEYACTRRELSCIIGNLFTEIEPPCERCGAADVLTISGTTYTGNKAVLTVTAKDLVKHTFRMTNDRRFPKKYRFTIVNRLHDLTIDIFQHIQEANELDLADLQEFRERRYEQKKALTKCKTVLFLIELSLELELISNDQCAAWTKAVLDVKYMTAKWRKQDQQRAATMQRGTPARR